MKNFAATLETTGGFDKINKEMLDILMNEMRMLGDFADWNKQDDLRPDCECVTAMCELAATILKIQEHSGARTAERLPDVVNNNIAAEVMQDALMPC